MDRREKIKNVKTDLEVATESVAHLASILGGQLERWNNTKPKEGYPKHSAIKLISGALNYAHAAIQSASTRNKNVFHSLMRPMYDLFCNYLFVTAPSSTLSYVHHTMFKTHGLREITHLYELFDKASAKDVDVEESNEIERLNKIAVRYSRYLLAERYRKQLNEYSLNSRDPVVLSSMIWRRYDRIRYGYLSSSRVDDDLQVLASRKMLVKQGEVRRYLGRILSAPQGEQSGALNKFASKFLHPNYGTLMIKFQPTQHLFAAFLYSLSTMLYMMGILTKARYFSRETFVTREIERAYRKCLRDTGFGPIWEGPE